MTQSELTTLGILKLRGMLSDGIIALPDRAAITALCDYAQTQIEARLRGGKATSHAKTEANRRNASKSRTKKPRCLCGKMTTDAARKNSHVCPPALTKGDQVNGNPSHPSSQA